ncbi:hypothetical protein SEA_GHOBES_37 [Gordonia phage Ghobes]|uniref:Uncharacterized protein n=1 Tax=Gordonia phage Ghobes TaxID=1887647 RepID=A0A1B3B083_9CAUD|nr:hypothetical protein KCH37_gp37 [Gordonia phage Ghobes]AOE44388.1 hypothetical protein SEA_GHOBES_37 [Gordonia phage Ghobes]
MEVTWTEKNPTPRARSAEEVSALLQELEAHPGEWAVYSEHKTRGAARQRVHALKSSRVYEGKPLEWSTKRTEPGNVLAPVQVLVRWVK